MQKLKLTPKWVKTTCPYCGTGCGVEAQVNQDNGVTIRGDESHPTNLGNLCSKGLTLADTLVPEGRLRECYIRGQAQSMETTLSYVASSFSKVIAEHGPDAVAFYVSGQLLTEDYYIANKLMKGFIGSSNIDSNSRLCMSSAVVAHKRAFGEDAVPACYADIEAAEHICLVGSNLAWCHPILFRRIKQAQIANPNLKITVIDPRRTDTCDIADLHLAIRPGTDVALYNGLLAFLDQENACDLSYISQHTEGFENALKSAYQSTPSWVELAAFCNIELDTMLAFFQRFTDIDKTLTLFSQGVNQSTSGTNKVNAIINCHLATGRVGKPGASPFSVTGQPNAMGGREVGGLASMLAAHMDFTPESHALVSEFWHTDKLATNSGAKAIDMFDQVHQGKIKAIWIMGTNPVVSLPDSDKIQQALLNCPLVVVSDCIAKSDTIACADVLLPAQGWGEKTGTVTNSERCISRQRGFLPSLGEAKADWWLLAEVAKRMGFTKDFSFASEAEVFAEYAQMTGFKQDTLPRGLDIAVLAGQDYHQHQPMQWPIRGEQSAARLFTDGQFSTPSGRANFIPMYQKSAASEVCQAYPMILNTGRNRDQWHSMGRTGLATKLNSHMPEPLLSINPQDLTERGIADGSLVAVESLQGKLLVRAHATESQNPSELFLPIHWSRENASAGAISSLVAAHTDPLSGQPENKYTPVSVRAWSHASRAALWSQRRLQVAKILPMVDYWVERRLEQGYLYYLASVTEPAMFFLQLKLALNNSYMTKQVDYENVAEQKYRFAMSLQGDSQDSLDISLMVTPANDADDNSWLASLTTLVPEVGLRTTLKGQADTTPSRMVCACHQVTENAIINAVEAGANTVAAVGGCNKAGTGCGSCIPEIKRVMASCESTISLVD
ncbi:MAG: molybdopterin-dependent oxidoreductase [Moritella sp.]|uniref:nitrate reductase n=1 Tax=Moritella sp. TaxID=78556 RepID=UPI0029A2EFCF|nr:molybdopterin-dependent oxidoreductase [Moritella sp.]MDX2319888.1 molybdopterin-dependent oxidoreductase [Moritella sp.]